MKNIFKTTFLAFMVRAAAAGMNLGMNLMFARMLTAADYGVVALGLAWLNILSVASCFGAETVAMKVVSRERYSGSTEVVRGVVFWSSAVAAVVGISMAVIGGLVSWWIMEDVTANQHKSLIIIIATAPLAALIVNYSFVLKGLKKTVISSFFESLLRPVLVVAACGVVYLAGSDFSVEKVVVSIVLSQFIIILAAFAFVVRVVQFGRYKIHYSEWFKAALPLAFVNILVVVMGNVESIMVGALVGVESAGVYRLCVQLAGLVSFGLAASNAVMSPVISELFHHGERDELKLALKKSARITALLGLVLAVFLFLVSGLALDYFGSEFSASKDILLLLLFSQLLNAFFASTGVMLSMIGKQLEAAKIIGVSMPLSLLLGYWMINEFGVYGAAISASISILLWNGAALIYIQKITGLNPSIFPTMPFLASKKF